MVSTTIPSRVKLRMAERSAVEPMRWRLVSTAKGTNKAIRHTAEQNLIEPFDDEKAAIISQSLLAEMAIRLGAHIQRVVP